MEHVFVCDIDNCFTDSREWVKHAPSGNTREGWDKFLELYYLATPNKPFVDMVCSVAATMKIAFLTGREDRKQNRERTIKQIEEFSNGKIIVGENAILIMRADCDYRPSAAVKKDMISILADNGYTPVSAIDDEEENCEVFRKFGIPTIHYDIEKNTKDWWRGFNESDSNSSAEHNNLQPIVWEEGRV